MEMRGMGGRKIGILLWCILFVLTLALGIRFTFFIDMFLFTLRALPDKGIYKLCLEADCGVFVVHGAESKTGPARGVAAD
jgi:hypothetical protein